MITRNATAFIAAIFLVTISNQAKAARTITVADHFCEARYCGQISTSTGSRQHRIKKAYRHKSKEIVTRKEKRSKPIQVASLGETATSEAPQGLLSGISRKFIIPLGVICVKPIAIGTNLLNSFKERVASIVEPVRKGYVAIQTASGKKAVVADKAANKFVNFIKALEATGYKIKDIGGYSYRRIAHTRQLSKHAFGLAIDINQIERDVVSVPMNRKQVSHIAASVGICSGGDWRNGDLGHFEICGNGRKKVRKVRYAKASA